MSSVSAGLVFSALAALAAAETLSYSRVHIVDGPAVNGNLLYRSNMPVLVNATTGQEYFALDTLISYMQERASEANVSFPSAPFKLAIHSLDDIFDYKDYQYEQAWAKANPDLGSFTIWMIAGQLLPPSAVNASEFNTLVHNNTALWGVDQLPTRIPAMHSLLNTAYDVPTVFLFHCEAGCDRTGEFASAYYMQELGMSAQAAYARSTAECGRAPDYFSTNAIEWYCDSLTAQGLAKPGNCTLP